MKLTALTLARELVDARRPLLPILAVVSFAAATWVALAAAGGLHMFLARAHEPQSSLDPRLVVEGTDVRETYAFLAALACVLVVPAVVALSANAAVAGASGREERLAVLRLLGITSWEANRVALWGTMAEAGAGIVLGTALSALSAPLWSALSFQYRPIGATEMYLPLLWCVLLWVALLAVTALAAVWGLLRVSISPLGVVRRQPTRRVGVWRLILFIAAFGAAYLAIRAMGRGSEAASGVVVWALVAVVLASLSLAMGFVLQLVATLLAAIPLLPPSVHTALARIAAQPVRTWNRVATTGFLCVVLGAVTTLPVPDDPASASGVLDKVLMDIRTGAYVTIGLSFLLFAVSTVLTQSARVVEQRELDRALVRMGVSRGFLFRVALTEVLLPLLLAMAAGVGVGRLLFSAAAQPGGTGVVWPVLAAGTALVVGAVGAAELVRGRGRVSPAPTA